jgi:hypothetical protein
MSCMFNKPDSDFSKINLHWPCLSSRSIRVNLIVTNCTYIHAVKCFKAFKILTLALSARHRRLQPGVSVKKLFLLRI